MDFGRLSLTPNTGEKGEAMSVRLCHVKKASDGFIKCSDVFGTGSDHLSLRCFKKVSYGLRKVSDGLVKVEAGLG